MRRLLSATILSLAAIALFAPADALAGGRCGPRFGGRGGGGFGPNYYKARTYGGGGGYVYRFGGYGGCYSPCGSGYFGGCSPFSYSGCGFGYGYGNSYGYGIGYGGCYNYGIGYGYGYGDYLQPYWLGGQGFVTVGRGRLAYSAPINLPKRPVTAFQHPEQQRFKNFRGVHDVYNVKSTPGDYAKAYLARNGFGAYRSNADSGK